MSNRLVRFKVSDVYIQKPKDVLNELHGNAVLQRKVMECTDDGPQEKVYVVVKVKDVKNFLIVPVDKVIVLES